MLPDNDRARVADLLRELGSGAGTMGRLKQIVTLLKAWQAKTNLVAPSTLPNIWERHVLDSLQCIAVRPDARFWLDLGSGGGFPGLVIGAHMAEAGGTVTLVESNGKKAAFLRQAARAADLPVRVFNCRIESAPEQIDGVEVVTARALAGLDRLLEMASPWLLEGAAGLFHKGREYRAELADCDGRWEFDLVDHESRISPDSVLLEITGLRHSGQQPTATEQQAS